MTSLFLDTSSSNLVLGVVKDQKVSYLFDDVVPTEMSIYLFPCLEEAFLKACIQPDDIDTIYVVNGPGSFTGIRIGLTVAKVYGWAMNKKVVPISSLELMATTKTDCSYILSIIDARHDYVFAGVYSRDLSIVMNDQYIALEDLLNHYKEDCVIVSRDSLDVDYVKPAIDILRIIEKHQYDEGVNPHTLCPNYLKKTQAEENLKHCDS